MMTICYPRLGQAVLLLALVMTMTGCTTSLLTKEEKVGASVYSLNYSGREVDYIAVEEVGNSNNGGGGDSLTAYSGGGQICCFGIPEKWKPGYQVVVLYQMHGDAEIRRVIVSVPAYPKDIAGDIWLSVLPDESVEAVVSHFGPPLAEWPGKIRGYPVGSKEYRLKRAKNKLNEAKESLARYQENLMHGDLTPERRKLNEELVNLAPRWIKGWEDLIKSIESEKP